MKKKSDMLHVLKVMHAMGFQRRRSNCFLLVVGGLMAGGMTFLGFAFMLTTLDTFAWLLYGTMVMGIVGGFFGIMWRMREAMEHIRNAKQDEPGYDALLL